jgi:hypothetical protein
VFLIVETIRSGLVNGNRPGFGCRVDLLACMQLQRLKMKIAHFSMFFKMDNSLAAFFQIQARSPESENKKSPPESESNANV